MSMQPFRRYITAAREAKNEIEINVKLVILLSLFKTASRIRYEITSGNIGGAFAVKNMTGAIYVAGALDYETRKRVSRREFLLNVDGQRRVEKSGKIFVKTGEN